MYVNNETGVIKPMQEVSTIAHEAGAYFMTDATQAIGKLPIDVDKMGIDLLTLSAHKFYGPKGVGALYVRRRNPFRVRVDALLHGGGHERGMRSGTLNVPGIVGLGAAAALGTQEMDADAKRIGRLRDALEARLLEIEDSWLNGSQSHRLWNVSNIGFRGVDTDALMMVMKNIAVSNGSACTSMIVEPSHVLRAMGLSEEESFGSVRFSLGRGNRMEEIEEVVREVNRAVNMLRVMS